MNYVSSTNPPRGEVCLRGPAVFMGYFKLPDKTEEAIDKDGWLHTGDVGEWTPNGCLRIIDRKKNIFKLAQGEYVAAEKIESVCGRCPLVAQCFVYGDSTQAWLVGIVVPDEEEVTKWLQEQGVGSMGLAELLGHAEHSQRLHDAVLAQMSAACKAAKLAGFEYVRRVTLTAEPWSTDNGLLTPTFKLKRNDAKIRFMADIEKMYAAGPAPLKAKL
mmetsp:Transcript_8937/g.17579  ORF Transcript_8937/g.17579 Transcript_8937/m.17579 type:complete len:216 (+) Transcript_8937:2-649(+)